MQQLGQYKTCLTATYVYHVQQNTCKKYSILHLGLFVLDDNENERL